MKVPATIIVIIFLFLLSSCVGIESRISLRRDGSGVLTLAYTVSQYIKNLDPARNYHNLPLPVSEEDFQRTVENIEGLRLSEIRQSEDEENLYIEAILEFDNIEAVNQLGNGKQMNLSLTAEDDATTFRQIIYSRQEGQEISEESIEMLESIFKGYELSFVIEPPAVIREYTHGEISEDKRKLSYRVSIAELMKANEDTVLMVKW